LNVLHYLFCLLGDVCFYQLVDFGIYGELPRDIEGACCLDCLTVGSHWFRRVWACDNLLHNAQHVFCAVLRLKPLCSRRIAHPSDIPFGIFYSESHIRKPAGKLYYFINGREHYESNRQIFVHIRIRRRRSPRQSSRPNL